ncbi:MipA/OmpV family protein [Permianibacter sp. IMCC34836]|uniref:MipA/OmpV family protein n=1 Tax=Permianibacter fluminis TaxID=2738515 RepID=UPI001551A1AB|nr:MipA/OmpV family protein [Permianibacter fluminis]NQD35483.1 MipA/OmpV family protein [Permianibacter fluminis]
MRVVALLALVASAISPSLRAANDVIAADDFDLKIAVGYGRLITPLATIDDADLYLLPSLSWYGERLYFEDGMFGYAVSEASDQQFDVVIFPSSDGLLYWYTQDQPLAPGGLIPTPMPVEPPFEVRGIEKRELAWHGGLRFAQQFGDAYWNVIAGKDISGVHHGWTATLAVGHDALLTLGKFTAGAELGLTYRSKRLVEYYYDNRADEVLPLDYVYEAEGDYSFQLQLRASYQFDQHWAAIARYGQHWLGDSVNSSPLVDRRDSIIWFTGLQYGF